MSATRLFAAKGFTITPAAAEMLAASGTTPEAIVERFVTGDWPGYGTAEVELARNLVAIHRGAGQVLADYCDGEVTIFVPEPGAEAQILTTDEYCERP